MTKTNYTMTRIHKDRLTELRILSDRYGLSQTQIIDQLVQNEFQKLLGDYASHDLTS